jgi:hypothetical protein|tara:strand:+ start:139 stop:423 length:285 start_codon:yes stop_codon:yes gene_type:complete
MGRALLIAEYFIQAKHKDPITGEEEDRTFPLYIANSHFESLDGPSILLRQDQMHDTFKVIFKNEPNCFIAGDYNFDNQEEYEYVEQNNFKDIIL